MQLGDKKLIVQRASMGQKGMPSGPAQLQVIHMNLFLTMSIENRFNTLNGQSDHYSDQVIKLCV